MRRGDLRHAVVVRAAYKRQRRDGMSVGFDDNACVLISKAGEPLGTRVTSESFPNLLLVSQMGRQKRRAHRQRAH